MDEYLFMAIICDRMKDREKAVKYAQKFVERDGWDDNLNNWLEDLLEEGDAGGGGDDDEDEDEDENGG